MSDKKAAHRKGGELAQRHSELIAAYQDKIIEKLRADRVVNLELLRRLVAARRRGSTG